MRKVIVRIYDRSLREWLDGVEGTFHMWGQSYDEYREGPGNYTMAIIELPDGRVVTALPGDVKFLT